MSESNRSPSLRWWLLAAAATTFIVVQANAIDPTPTNTFTAGTAISASEVNQNFADLYGAVSALEAQVAATEYEGLPIGTVAFFAFNFVPEGWAPCDGSIYEIAGNEALFSTIGPTYGGNGTEDFALPDVRSRQLVGDADVRATESTGGGVPVGIIDPYLALNCAIRVDGPLPVRAD